MTSAELSRRNFIKMGGALVVSVAASGIVDTALGPVGALGQVSGVADRKPPLTPDELDSWIAVLPDGGVRAFFGKMDMGPAAAPCPSTSRRSRAFPARAWSARRTWWRSSPSASGTRCARRGP
jgi:hypothetical protein